MSFLTTTLAMRSLASANALQNGEDRLRPPLRTRISGLEPLHPDQDEASTASALH